MRPRLCLAPVKGITDVIYRNCVGKLFGGFDYAVTPFFVADQGGCGKPGFNREVSPEDNCVIPAVPQLLSKNPEMFLQFADHLLSLGYKTVNWNLGCPSPMVSNRKRGAGLLPFPDFIDSFLESVCSRFAGNVSVKVRLGRNDESEIYKLLPVLNRYPVTEIIVHPRTGIQMYEGKVNLDVFEEVIALTHHTVVYSGDIWNHEIFRELSTRFPGVNRWMLGRGALMNPFLPCIIKGENHPAERFATIKRFHDLLLSEYKKSCSGATQTMGKMKNIWHYLSFMFPENPDLVKKIYKAGQISSYQKAVDSLFNAPIRR